MKDEETVRPSQTNVMITLKFDGLFKKGEHIILCLCEIAKVEYTQGKYGIELCCLWPIIMSNYTAG